MLSSILILYSLSVSLLIIFCSKLQSTDNLYPVYMNVIYRNIHAFNLLCTTHIIFIALMVVFLVIIIGRLIAPWSVLARAWFKPKTIKLVFVVSLLSTQYYA